MSDLIERQTAINAIDELPNCYNGFSDSYDKAYIIGVLEDLPSAEQKKGKWLIAEKDRYIVHSVRCSVCGYCISWMANYCPNCGAKMGGKTDEID